MPVHATHARTNTHTHTHIRAQAHTHKYTHTCTHTHTHTHTRTQLFVVRWTVFLLGPAGCGKTAIWRTLMRTQNALGEKTIYRPINPKAVTRNELYGCVHECGVVQGAFVCQREAVSPHHALCTEAAASSFWPHASE